MFINDETSLPTLFRQRADRATVTTVVAVPVCNEAERIGTCLRALDEQVGVLPGSVGIVLLLNNCTDDTAAVAATYRLAMRSPVRIIETVEVVASAGRARCQAMDAAAAWLVDEGAVEGVILTTDADSRVGPGWVRLNRYALAHGADAVAGRVSLDPVEATQLPAALRTRGKLEDEYGQLLTELDTWLDPQEHDPWPCHRTASGASLAVSLTAYRHVGGMPPLAVGEDRAFVEALQAYDLRVRHECEIEVVTSARLEGRAIGGAADTMKARCDVPDSPCDPRLEPLGRALFRYVWRRRLRALHMNDRLQHTSSWARDLVIPSHEADEIAGLPTAGRVLQAVERLSPRLRHEPLTPRQLPAQIQLAQAALSEVRMLKRLPPAERRSGGNDIVLGRSSPAHACSDAPVGKTAT